MKDDKYFVLVDMGYDGKVIIQYDTEVEARKEYGFAKEPMDKGYYQGRVLMRGKILEKDNFDI